MMPPDLSGMPAPMATDPGTPIFQATCVSAGSHDTRPAEGGTRTDDR